MSELNYAAYTANCAASDLKHIHLHAAGELFDDVHETAQTYYEKLSADTDMLCEFAMEMNLDVQNLGKSMSIVDWEPETSKIYTFKKAYQCIKKAIVNYVENLSGLQDIPSHVQTWVDDCIQYWLKEVNYKIERKLCEMEEETTGLSFEAEEPEEEPELASDDDVNVLENDFQVFLDSF